MVATTDRADAIASSVARPNGSTRLGWQTTSAAAIQAGTSSCADAADEPDPGPSLERAAQRAVADERERALAALLERAREAEDVLALGEPAEAEERRPVAAPAELVARRLGVARREALEVDAAVDHLGLARASGTSDTSRSRSQPETAITPCGAPDDVAGSRRARPGSSRRSRRPDRAR